MQLFSSAWMYGFLFCLIVFTIIGRLLPLPPGISHEDLVGLSVGNVLGALGTIIVVVYLPILFRKISNKIERLGLVLFELGCVLWMANFLAKQGVAWAVIPYGQSLRLIFDCVIAVLAGVRTYQVMFHRGLRLPALDGLSFANSEKE